MIPSQHPLLAILASPEIVSGFATVVVLGLGYLAVRLQLMQNRLHEQLDGIHSTAAAASQEAAKASTEATKASAQVTNSHTTNLRDDLDAIARQMREGLTAIQNAQARQEEAQERRVTALETQIQSLRDYIGRIDQRAINHEAHD